MPVTKVKVNGEWVPAMPVGGGGEGDMTKAVYDTNDDGVVNAADQATKDGSGNVITSTYAAKATTLSGYGITDAKIQNGSIILGGNSITPLTSFTETDPVFTASAAYGISSSDITKWNGKQAPATTLSGYGITDAYISNGTITLGSNTITPLTSYTETDPIFTASAAHGITSSDITNWNNKSGYIIGYCDTPAATAVKEIQIFDPQFEGQSTSGETLLIRFKYGNSNTSSSLAFKIGDTTRLASVCSFYDYDTGSSTTNKTFSKGIHALELDNDGWNFYEGCDVHTAFSSARATKAVQDNSGNTITSTYATKAELPTGTLTINIGSTSYAYDGSTDVTITLQNANGVSF